MLPGLGLGISLLLFSLIRVMPAHAQTALVSSSPSADAVIPNSPERVILTFNHILVDQGTEVWVTNEAGERIDKGDAAVDPSNRFAVFVSLPLLPEGLYTVSYAAVGLGDSTITVGDFQFAIDLPPPRLALKTPVNGQAFECGPVLLEMQVGAFDFEFYNNRIRVYVDGELRTELRELTYEVEGLEPGVHEIRVVPTQFEDQELPEAAITVYIAIAQPTPQPEGGEQIATTAPDSDLQLTPSQWGVAVALGLFLLGVGLWLGQAPRK